MALLMATFTVALTSTAEHDDQRACIDGAAGAEVPPDRSGAGRFRAGGPARVGILVSPPERRGRRRTALQGGWDELPGIVRRVAERRVFFTNADRAALSEDAP